MIFYLFLMGFCLSLMSAVWKVRRLKSYLFKKGDLNYGFDWSKQKHCLKTDPFYLTLNCNYYQFSFKREEGCKSKKIFEKIKSQFQLFDPTDIAGKM